jgi:hypothetical protein
MAQSDARSGANVSSEFANVHWPVPRLLNNSREQTLPSGVVAEFVFGAPAGSVLALGGIDGASLRALLDQVDQGPDDRRALFVRIELAPTAEAIVERVIELLADTASSPMAARVHRHELCRVSQRYAWARSRPRHRTASRR